MVAHGGGVKLIPFREDVILNRHRLSGRTHIALDFCGGPGRVANEKRRQGDRDLCTRLHICLQEKLKIE